MIRLLSPCSTHKLHQNPEQKEFLIKNLKNHIYIVQDSLRYSYDGEERKIVARRSQSPLWWQRQIHSLRRTEISIVILGWRRQRSVELERLGDGVWFRFTWDFNCSCHRVLSWGVELPWATHDLGKAIDRRRRRWWWSWSVRGKLRFKSPIFSGGCHGQLLHLAALYHHLNAWKSKSKKYKSISEYDYWVDGTK